MAIGTLNLKSLREQVYDYLKAELKRGALEAGGFLDLKLMAKELGVSRTPLRDALIQLEVEEFVRISPRRGVSVRTLDERDIREIYQLVGALEASALLAVAPRLGAADFQRLRDLDERSRQAVASGDLDAYYESNYEFHDFFLDRHGNQRMTALIHLKKHQLYDWSRKFERPHAQWDRNNIQEHEEIIRLLETGAFQAAADYLRDVHWGFAVQAAFVQEAYFQEPS
jgi:DNA-binding GntR family transcriptional regulator